MNNKELTEKIKKDITGILEEKSDLKLATSYYDSRVEGINAIVDYIIKTTQSNDEIKREAVEEFLKSQIEYEAEEYAVCPLCKRELIWGETYCPDDRRKLITETRNKLEWSNRNTVIKELIESLTQKENNE